ncbi:uncharacterized protein LOC123683482 isoform X2 [Harmonia axyridis]|uniref:uncharacterized protein LOC123683482 isoform X2 n=1 Tax=Harmonia axyridis TaxID=115357 RepID=UPI001E275F8F|nr:uncharacterized protein LOC123683482 isoform X2 [Harmonia axyridis]
MSQNICDLYIKISCMTGHRYLLVVSGSHTIENLKEMMSKSYRLPKLLISLSFNGRTLKDHETLSSIGVRNDSVLNMVLKMQASSMSLKIKWPEECTKFIEFVEKVKNQLCGDDPPKERIMVLVEGGGNEGPFRVNRVCKESDYKNRLDKCRTLFSPQMLKLLILTVLVKLVEEFRMKMNIYKLRQKMREIAQKKMKKKFVEKPGIKFWCDYDKKDVPLVNGMDRYETVMFVKTAITYPSIMTGYQEDITGDMTKYSNLIFRTLGKLSQSNESAMTFTSEEQVWRFLFQKCRQDQNFLIRIRPPRRNLIMLRLRRWAIVKRQELAKRVAYLVARTTVQEAEGYLKYCANKFQNAVTRLKSPRQYTIQPTYRIFQLSGTKKSLEDTSMETLLEKLKLNLSRKFTKKLNKEPKKTCPMISKSTNFKADEAQMENYLEKLFDDELVSFDNAYFEHFKSNTPEGLKQGKIYHPKVVDQFSAIFEEAEHFGLSTPEESEQDMLFEEVYQQYLELSNSEESEEDQIYHPTPAYSSMNEPLQDEVSLEDSFFAEMSYECLADLHAALLNDLNQKMSNQKVEEPYQENLYRKPTFDDVYLRKLWMNIYKRNLLEDHEKCILNLSYEFIADIHEAFRRRISKKICNYSYSMESYESLGEIHGKVLKELRTSFVKDDLYEALAEFHESMRLHISKHLEQQRHFSTIPLDIVKQNRLNKNTSPEATESLRSDSSDGSQLRESEYSDSSSADNESEVLDKDTFFYSTYDNSKYSSTTGTLNSNNGEPTVETQERTTIGREVKLTPHDDGRVKKTRCTICRKRLNITNVYDCRCGNLYCAAHVYAELHDCNYDYKKNGKEILRKKYPKLYVEKIKKI